MSKKCIGYISTNNELVFFNNKLNKERVKEITFKKAYEQMANGIVAYVRLLDEKLYATSWIKSKDYITLHNIDDRKDILKVKVEDLYKYKYYEFLDEGMSDREFEIFKNVNNILCFADNSDYGACLWEILFLLKPEWKDDVFGAEDLEHIDEELEGVE